MPRRQASPLLSYALAPFLPLAFYVALVICSLWATAFAQGTKADYERADGLRDTTRDKVFRTRVTARWFAENTRFWYRIDLADRRREFVLVHVDEGQRGAAFDHARLAKALTEALGENIDPARLPLDLLQFEGKALRFNARDRGWRCDLDSYELAGAEKLEKPPEPTRQRGRSRDRARGRRGGSRSRAESPDGKWEALIEDHNVHVREKESGEKHALSREGTESDAYQSRFYWSPNSRRLVAIRRAKEEEHTVHNIESSPKDQVQPKLHSRQYLKPGDRIAISRPHLFDIAEKSEIPIRDELFGNPWRIDEVRWDPESRRFTFRYNQRGHQVLRIVAVDAETGETGTIVDEHSETFIDYPHKTFTHYLDQTHELIWMSERDGWNHLYRYDSRTAQVMNQITAGPWVVRGVDRVDEEKREIWFRAGGIYPEQDPYYIHHCRIGFDGSGLVVMTRGNGTHEVEFSPDRRFLIDRYSRVDMPAVTELRRVEDGSLVCELERGDASALRKTGWRSPERFVATGRDDRTNIYGVIYRPKSLDEAKKYPIIEHIYAGPQTSYVPKNFRSYYRQQALAELGFIVVAIDGMGTSNRSKAFHDVCWKNLRDAGFPDRIRWIRAAAERYPYMDTTRVGIYGGSAGGQNTLSGLLHHPEFYKVGAADCGCHDNRMDKIWWNELWMGWPVGEEYADNSNVTHADKLQGKLLLTAGEMDKNVPPESTLQVVGALIKANKDFDFLLVPGGGHGIGDSSRYALRRRRDFFVRHLHGVEPRSEATSE